ncbi:MAG: hypothetical protein DI585_05390 [Pseudomonas fluorescens]|nr:MAG: hypothetical protein DI585_05390 [Pseudomonas fluorescens]
MDYRRKFSAYASRADAQRILFAIAFLEGVFLPLPSDFLLIPMCLLVPDRAFRFAAVAALGSVCGAMVGFTIGWLLQSMFLENYAFLDVFRWYSPVFILSAGFSTVPFNLVTLLSGVSHVNPLLFAVLTLGVRLVRYGLIAWLIWRSGNKYQDWLERNFGGTTLVITLVILVISAFGVLFFETA